MIIPRIFVIFFLSLVLSFFVPSGALPQECSKHAPAYDGTYCWDNFNTLITHLNDTSRRNGDYRIVQPRNGRQTPITSHNQYNNSCFFFSSAPIVEHLGWSRFAPGGHYSRGFFYFTRSSINYYFPMDVGYLASPEHLIITYLSFDVSYRYLANPSSYDNNLDNYPPNGFYVDDYDAAGDPVDLDDAPRTTLNRNLVNCYSGAGAWYNYWEPGDEYGWCANLTGGDRFERWINAPLGGCSRGECPCEATAGCGIFWFMNRVLPHDTSMAGCNDARNITPNSTNVTQVNATRRIIKAFVDHNIPLLVAVDNGGHFMTLVGYAELDADNLPIKGILADPVDKMYWTPLLTATNWDLPDRWSLVTVHPWNQHLDRACETGGWAKDLDPSLPSGFKLCTIEDELEPERCVPRHYGITVTCENDGAELSSHFAYVEDPFISDSRSIDCDKVIVRYADGANTVTSATARRYQYNSYRHEWEILSTYSPNSLSSSSATAGRSGPESTIVWDGAWHNNYWLVAQDLEGQYTKRRTSIELNLDTGQKTQVEITPPNTYGLSIKCIDDGSVVAEYYSESDHEVSSGDGATHYDKQIFFESGNVSCDRIQLSVNLGQGIEVTGAEIERQYYSLSEGRWQKANSTAPWSPDMSAYFVDGLSGYTRIFTWHDIWPDNYFVVAENVGDGASYGDRKTVVRLKTGDGTIFREIDIVPN